MIFDSEAVSDLFNGEKAICFFVHRGKNYWVLDYKYNFSLDAEKDYQAYLKDGDITKEQYFLACKEFRYGVLKLQSDNFLQYIGGVGKGVLTSEELRGEFNGQGGSDAPALLDKVEKYHLSGFKLESECFMAVSIMSSKLPMFYINFDRKIYMHLDFGRCHEDLVYSDWFAKFSDFSFLIPDRERYWVDGRDYWKLRYIQGPY